MSLESIERLTKEHAADRALLAERVQALHDEIEQVKRRKLAGLKYAVSQARDSKLRLASAIEDSKSVFAKPRTRVFHGIKVGLQKGKGKLSWPSQKRVIELIRKRMPDKVETLIKSTEKPVKAALMLLPADELTKLSCSISSAGDQVVIAPINTEIDELVQTLLGDGDEDDDEDAE